ncbi:MAG: MotA/TolQ/ExbB proton channel family protein [Candidatus Omnitrophica bacterium]|nr:MotA/TolQ/ExbB proton channel family protein [Candidatus Omnitrophota bacterium]
MITTAAGLMVAIPLYMCYTYFVSRIKYISNSLNDHCIQLLEIFSDTNKT